MLPRSAPDFTAACRTRRRGLAAVVLALPLLLVACSPQTDTDTADTVGAAASPTTSASDSTSPSPEAAESTAECSDDAYDYVALEMVDCEEAQEAVSGVVSSGKKTHLSVEDGKTACTPGSGRWTCTFAGEASPATIELEPKDPDQDPLADVAAVSRTDPDAADPSDAPEVTGLGTYAENVDVQCSNDDYDFADVSGLDCSEAEGIMQEFLDQEVEGTIDDVRCTQGTDLFDDGTRETWSCLRLSEEGGSFIAYSR